MELTGFEFADKVDDDGEMEIVTQDGDGGAYNWINRDDAIRIIQHLQTYFKIPV